MIKFFKTLWLKITCKQCISCGECKKDVKEVVDPYLAEVLHMIKFKPFCRSCLDKTNQDADAFSKAMDS